MFQRRDVTNVADDALVQQGTSQFHGFPPVTVRDDYPDCCEQQMSNGFQQRSMPANISSIYPLEKVDLPTNQSDTSLSDLTTSAGSCINYLQFSPSNVCDHDNFPLPTSVNFADEGKTYTMLSTLMAVPQVNTQETASNLSPYQNQNVLSSPVISMSRSSSSSSSSNNSSSSALEWNADASEQSLFSDESGFVKTVMNVAVKMNLQQKIKSRKGNIKPEYRQSVEEKLSLEDARKRQDRKLRNKKAAEKCRRKKRTEQKNLEEKAKVLEEQNEKLRQECVNLEKQKGTFKELLSGHELDCALMPPSSHQVGNNVIDSHNTCNNVFNMETVFSMNLPGNGCTYFNDHTNSSEQQLDIFH